MKRTVLFAYLVLSAVAALESVFASTNLAVQLLELSAPAPDWRALPAERLVPVEYREKKLAEKNAPPPSEQELKEQERARIARLVRDAKCVRLHDEYDFLVNRAALDELAELDWGAAKPILDKYATNEVPQVAIYALGLLYTYAAPEDQPRLRETLQTIVFDDTAPASSRANACTRILESDWAERDEWFLNLLGILPDLKEGYSDYQPLEDFVIANPEKWIPILTELVNDTNTVKRARVISCLLQFSSENAREDALRPLLPWVRDPEWANVDDGRSRLIYSMGQMDLPESVPDLLWVADNEGGFVLGYAASALAHYNAIQAIPVLKGTKYRQRGVIEAIHELGGFSDEEIIFAIETFAEDISFTSISLRHSKHWWTYQLGKGYEAAVGRYMSAPDKLPARISEMLLARATIIEKESPQTAEVLRPIALSGEDVANGRLMLDTIESPCLTKESLRIVLNNREMLRKYYTKRLREISDRGGIIGSVAVVLAGSSYGMNDILRGKDREAQLMLLACSRLTDRNLPIDAVAELLDGLDDPPLRAAIEKYLRADDGEKARALLLATFPRKPSALERYHSDNPPEEVFRLSDRSWDGGRDFRIMVRDGVGTLTVFYNNERYGTRTLSDAELSEFRRSIGRNHIDDLPPLLTDGFDGAEYTYSHLTPHLDRSVYMYSPTDSVESAPIYDFITKLFHKLEAADGLSLHYECEDEIDGFRVLHFGNKEAVDIVWSEGDDTRVLISTNSAKPQRWRRFGDGRILDDIEQPAACQILGAFDDKSRGLRLYDDFDLYPWQSGASGKVVRANFDGLWHCEEGEEAIQLRESAYADPIVSSGGRWVVAAKAEDGWAAPNVLVRFDLQDRKEYVVDIPPAADLGPVALIPSLGKVLACRITNDYGRLHDAKHYLVDPATGDVEAVEGGFAPLHQQTYRSLQSARKPGFCWAALYDHEIRSTQVGLYEMASFSFAPMMAIPSLNFDSMEMWVDEGRSVVYVVVNGDLVRFALQDWTDDGK